MWRLASLLSYYSSCSKSYRNNCESYRSVTGCRRRSRSGNFLSGSLVHSSIISYYVLNNVLNNIFSVVDLVAFAVDTLASVNVLVVAYYYSKVIPVPVSRSVEEHRSKEGLSISDLAFVGDCCPVKGKSVVAPVELIGVVELHCDAAVYNDSAGEEVGAPSRGVRTVHIVVILTEEAVSIANGGIMNVRLSSLIPSVRSAVGVEVLTEGRIVPVIRRSLVAVSSVSLNPLLEEVRLSSSNMLIIRSKCEGYVLVVSDSVVDNCYRLGVVVAIHLTSRESVYYVSRSVKSGLHGVDLIRKIALCESGNSYGSRSLLDLVVGSDEALTVVDEDLSGEGLLNVCIAAESADYNCCIPAPSVGTVNDNLCRNLVSHLSSESLEAILTSVCSVAEGAELVVSHGERTSNVAERNRHVEGLLAIAEIAGYVRTIGLSSISSPRNGNRSTLVAGSNVLDRCSSYLEIRHTADYGSVVRICLVALSYLSANDCVVKTESDVGLSISRVKLIVNSLRYGIVSVGVGSSVVSNNSYLRGNGSVLYVLLEVISKGNSILISGYSCSHCRYGHCASHYASN